MCEPNCPSSDRELAERLRREDRADRPAFSEDLHAKICAALDAPAPPAASRLRGPAEALRPRWLAAALMAACAAAFAVVLWRTREAPRDVALPERPPAAAPAVEPAPPPEADLAPVVSLPGDLSKLPLLVDTAIASQQWAWLDHDARLTAQMLAARLPFDAAWAPPDAQGM